ncbi:MAG TPA: hypothetical protein VNO32_56975 [Candidatus Acidoferrum sp.]|nr:hypothetical protein [Candidatus Acidoferrum sp.]
MANKRIARTEQTEYSTILFINVFIMVQPSLGRSARLLPHFACRDQGGLPERLLPSMADVATTIEANSIVPVGA